MRKCFNIFVILLLPFYCFQSFGNNESTLQNDQIEVLMRKIGHEILLQANDSTSLVKPIIQEGNEYRIQFGVEFGFPPEGIIVVIDSILNESHLKESYLVKIEKCETSELVYSYEVDVFAEAPFPDAIACKERPQPTGCYEIVIQFIPEVVVEVEDNNWVVVLVVLLIVILFLGQYIYYKKRRPKVNKDAIKIGEYLYDSKKMILIREEKTIELTSKESELLNLLYGSANETVERDIILNKVWGDEGDYVGRTLDVYVSKLRKKLENDNSVQIKNIRGVGYKLIVER